MGTSSHVTFTLVELVLYDWTLCGGKLGTRKEHSYFISNNGLEFDENDESWRIVAKQAKTAHSVNCRSNFTQNGIS